MATVTEHRPAATLTRGLTVVDATMLVIGSMIGSGIFITSAESARLVGSPGWLLAAWGLTGLLTIAGALCCAELATMMPRAGGPYLFFREAYGPLIAFLFGWASFLIIQSGTIAAVAIAFASFLGVLVPQIDSENYLIQPIVIGRCALGLSTQQLVAVLIVTLLTFLNMCGLRTAKIVQNVFTVAKTSALVGLIFVGLVFGWNHCSAAYTSAWWQPTLNGWQPSAIDPRLAYVGSLALAVLLARAMVGPMFSQSAWNNVTFAAGEVADPSRNLPRSLFWGCGTVVILYVLANAAYILTLPLSSIQHAPQQRVAAAVMKAILGQKGAILIALAIMVSTFGCTNGLILSGARVSYAMARDGLFFARVGTLNRHRVPGVALAVQGMWTVFLLLPRTLNAPGAERPFANVYSQLLDYVVSVDLLFYCLTVGAVVVLRYRASQWPRSYRVWGYPFTVIGYLLIAAWMIGALAYLAPLTTGIGYMLVLTGVPAYLLWRRPSGTPGVCPARSGQEVLGE